VLDLRLYAPLTLYATKNLALSSNSRNESSRFAHHSPHIFATSSFDKTVKLWDVRVPSYAGIASHGSSSSSSGDRHLTDQEGASGRYARPFVPSRNAGNISGSRRQPLYTVRSTVGHVMVCFSPDDMHLLTSAVDNEVSRSRFWPGLAPPLPRPPSALPSIRPEFVRLNSLRFLYSGSTVHSARWTTAHSLSDLPYGSRR
jgi:WD40 repeat protein